MVTTVDIQEKKIKIEISEQTQAGKSNPDRSTFVDAIKFNSPIEQNTAYTLYLIRTKNISSYQDSSNFWEPSNINTIKCTLEKIADELTQDSTANELDQLVYSNFPTNYYIQVSVEAGDDNSYYNLNKTGFLFNPKLVRQPCEKICTDKEFEAPSSWANCSIQ